MPFSRSPRILPRAVWLRCDVPVQGFVITIENKVGGEEFNVTPLQTVCVDHMDRNHKTENAIAACSQPLRRELPIS